MENEGYVDSDTSTNDRKARQLAMVKGCVNVGTKTRKKPRKYGKLADFVGKGR